MATSRIVTWSQAMRFAAPPVGLFLLARGSSEWLSVTAWSGLFACVLVMIVVGTRWTIIGWRDIRGDVGHE